MRMLSTVEAAARSGLSFPTFQRRLAAGNGPVTVRLGRRRLVRESDLNTWLSSLPAA